MSKGDKSSYSVWIEKTYWLFQPKDSNEINCNLNRQGKPEKNKSKKIIGANSEEKTFKKPNDLSQSAKKIGHRMMCETDSDRKRKGTEMRGPPVKKVKNEKVKRSDVANTTSTESTSRGSESVKQKKAPIIRHSQTPKIESENPESHQHKRNGFFDDVESVGSEYERGRAFIASLFNDLETITTDGTDASASTSYCSLNNFFDDFPSDYDEDRVIITEIFDDEEMAVPEKPKN